MTGDVGLQPILFMVGVLLLLLGATFTLLLVMAYLILRVSAIQVVDSDLQTVTFQGVGEVFLDAYHRYRFDRREDSAAVLTDASQDDQQREERIQNVPLGQAKSGILNRPPLEFTLNRDDYLAFYMHVWEKRRRSPWGRCRAALLLLVIVGPAVAAISYFISDFVFGFLLPNRWLWVAGPAGGLVAFLLIEIDLIFGLSENSRVIRERHHRRWWLQRFYLPRFEARGRIDVTSTHQLWIDAEGVLEITHFPPASADAAQLPRREEVQIPWTEMEEVVATPMQALLVHRTESAFIIPKSAFPTEAAFADFVDEAREYLEDARRTRDVSGQARSKAAV
jgi:hypothetical protein